MPDKYTISSDEFPEVLRENEQNIQSTLKEMCDKHGTEVIKEHILTYSERLSEISRINTKFLQLDPDKDELEYANAVANIMSATQDYYSYVGKLPEDIKKMLLQMANTATTDNASLEDLGTFVNDKSLLLDTSVLFSMQSIRPKNYIMQIDAISNKLPQLQEQTQLRVGTRGNQPVTTSVTLDMPEHMKIEGGSTLSTYDKSIINGVTSLLESGNTAFSIPMLYHAMTGKQNPTIDEQLYEEIGGKLEKMRRMMLSIDLTEESRAQYLTDESGNPIEISQLTIEGYLLPLNKMVGVINGKKTEVYQMIQPPPLYTYSKMRRQLATAPITLLNAPINNNATTIPLKTYLLQRIELMKNRKNTIVSRNILYDSIYSELNAEGQNKTQKMRIRRYTTTILDYFIEQEYIKSYVEYKDGRTIKGLKIEL